MHSRVVDSYICVRGIFPITVGPQPNIHSKCDQPEGEQNNNISFVIGSNLCLVHISVGFFVKLVWFHYLISSWDKVMGHLFRVRFSLWVCNVSYVPGATSAKAKQTSNSLTLSLIHLLAHSQVIVLIPALGLIWAVSESIFVFFH